MNHSNIINALSTIRPSSTFLQLHNYRNQDGEVANYNIVFHVSYKNALERAIATLQTYQPENELEAQAKQELIDGYQASLQKDSDTMQPHYQAILSSEGLPIKGVKIHKSTNTLHLYGTVVTKKVVKKGKNKTTKSKPLTMAKNKLRSLTSLASFSQFKITPSNLDKIVVEKMELLPSST